MSRFKIVMKHRCEGLNGTLEVSFEGEHDLIGSPAEVRAERRALLEGYKEDLEWMVLEEGGEDFSARLMSESLEESSNLPTRIKRTLMGEKRMTHEPGEPISATSEGQRGERSADAFCEDLDQDEAFSDPNIINSEQSRALLKALGDRLKAKRGREEPL